MKRLIVALGIAAGVLVLALAVGLAGSIRIFGIAALGMLMVIASPLCLVFALWLSRQGYPEYGRLFKVAAGLLLLGAIVQFKLPDIAPGTTAYLRSWLVRADTDNARAALERLSPKAVECGPVLIGPHGETMYWWHPSDEPTVCYDGPGEHPKGRGPVYPVDRPVAQMLDRIRNRPAPVAPPPVVAVAVPPPAPAPGPTPEPAPQSPVNRVTTAQHISAKRQP